VISRVSVSLILVTGGAVSLQMWLSTEFTAKKISGYAIGDPVWETAVTTCAGANGLVRRTLCGTP